MYKVVRVKDEKRLSAIETPMQVEYREGEWTEAAIGKLFIMRDPDDACNFLAKFLWLEPGSHYEVWEVEAKGVDKLETACPHVTNAREIKAFWEGRETRKVPTPPGTLGAKKVKLVRRVLSVKCEAPVGRVEPVITVTGDYKFTMLFFEMFGGEDEMVGEDKHNRS